MRLPDNPSGIRTLTNEEADRLDGAYPGMPTPQNCVTCGGHRSFQWWNPDRTEVVTYECDCISQWMLYRYFMFSGVGLNYQRIGWLDVDAERDATDQVIKWMAGSEWNVRNGVGLILHGSMGTGKTMLSNLVLKAMLAEGYEGYQTTLANMIDLHTAGWNGKNEEKSWYYRRVKNVDVLVIDDVGREVRQQRMVDTADGRVMKSHASPVVQVALEDVLRHRTTISRPTILTMNLSLREFREKYGEHSIGLMDESAVAIEFRGVTWRPKKREREEQERAMRLSRPVVVG